MRHNPPRNRGEHHERSDRHRIRRPHADRRPARRLRRAAGVAAGRRRHPRRRRARGRQGRGRRGSADGLLPDGGPGPGAGAPGRPRRRPAAVGRRRDAVEDVRVRHAHDDVRARHAGRRQRQHPGRGRHGEHDQRAAPARQLAQGLPLRSFHDLRPHGARRPRGRLPARQGDGRVRRGLRRQVRLHARGAGPVRDRVDASARSRPTPTAASAGKSRR